MTTPILPTRAVLLATALTPTALIRDQQVEEILADHYDLIRGMLSAWRAGQESFAYSASSSTIGNTLKDILEEYGYTVIVTNNGSRATVTVSWAA